MKKTLRFLLLLAAPVLTGIVPPMPRAQAAEVVRDAVLGQRATDELSSGDVHAFRIALPAGTDLRFELRAKDDGDALPLLVLLDPAGVEVGRANADDDLRITTSAAGAYRAEVRAGGYAGEYELRLDGDPPKPSSSSSKSVVQVTDAPVTVHVEAPVPSSVEIEVRRRSGAPPRVASVTDGLGRALTVFVRDSRASRVRLEPVPVGIEGGIDVAVAADGPGGGTYEVRLRVRAGADRARGGDDRDERRVVVLLAPGADAAAVAASLGFTLVEVRGNLAVLDTGEGREGREDEDAEAAHAHPDVLGAEPDLVADLPEGSQYNAGVVGSDLGRASLESQSALSQVRASIAHRTATGAGVVVAVLDGGADAAHAFLAGRTLPGKDFVDGDDDASEETDGLDDDGDGRVDEGFGHGTFVASLVLAAAPDAEVLPVRVLATDGLGRVSDVAAGITWATDRGAHVINLSLGTFGGSTTVSSAVRYAQSKGVLVVAATGNDANPAAIDFPAAMAGVVAVSGLDAGGARAPFANAGAGTSLAAPSVDLIGAYPGERYATWSGTSFSAALVSGGAALAVQRAPTVPPSRVAAKLTAGARRLAKLSARQRRALGAGALDLAKAAR